MKRSAILIALAIGLGLSGCESRECHLIKTIKGDEVCEEDVQEQREQRLQHQEAAEPGWNGERGARKAE